MSTQLSIHPQYSPASGLNFTAGGPRARHNANVITLKFTSAEYNASVANANPGFTVGTDVTLFGLSDTDADILANVGRLDEDRRKDLLPVIERLLEGMSIEAIIQERDK